MGTGVGEAMLLQSLATGAAVGAGTSALTGQDPLKGAMFGALGGAVMPTLGSALGGGAAGAGSATAEQVAGQLGVQGASTAAGSQADLIAKSLQGFGPEGLEATRSAAATALPQNVMPAGISQAAGTAITQAPLPNIANVPQTGFTDIFKSTPGGPGFGERVGNYIVQNPGMVASTGAGAANMFLNRPENNVPGQPEYDGPLKFFKYDPRYYRPAFASGGIADSGIPATSRGMFYPQSQLPSSEYAVPSQMPTSAEVVAADYEPQVNPYTGQPMAKGGIADLGSYSDGGRMLKGPGDGMSDSIPARIGSHQPARLADGEFVVPADVVSHLGNGSTDAGAKQLYAMMDKVRKARTGTKKQGREIKPHKYLPA